LDQTAFLPMRYILDNIFLAHETIYHAKQSSQPLVFLKLDYSKAYNRVDLQCLFGAMHIMDFPSKFIELVQLLFVGARAYV
jgi:hypothetical protein